jgi:peptidyl-prolyl cis-trans isomerase A (cyclophilin A)
VTGAAARAAVNGAATRAAVIAVIAKSAMGRLSHAKMVGKVEAQSAMSVPDQFKVKFETTKGDFTVEVNKAWAPIGVERFHELVTSAYFDNSKFFRVVPRFVVQFGLAADPAASQRYEGARLKDDPVTLSNVKGTLSFATAGPNTRTTQIFINLVDNVRLDGMGFSPFAKVTEGMEVVEALYGDYGDNGPNQSRIRSMGNAYMEASFPKLDGMKKVSIVE